MPLSFRDETVRQMVTNYGAPVGGHINPFAIHDTFGMYSSATKCRVITPEQVDIDLGSECKNMGFPISIVYFVAHTVPSVSLLSDANNLGFEDAIPYAPPVGGKKKRKSRKKRQANRHTNQNGEVDDHQNEDESEDESESEEKEKEKEGQEEKKAEPNKTESGEEEQKPKAVSAADIFAAALAKKATPPSPQKTEEEPEANHTNNNNT